MSVEVVVWNLEGRLGDAEWSQRIVGAIAASHAEVIVLAKPYDDEALEFSTIYTAKEQLTDHGLQFAEVNNGPQASRLLMVNRQPADSPREVKIRRGQRALVWPTRNTFDEVVVNVAAVHTTGLTPHARSQEVRRLVRKAPEIDIIAGNISSIQASEARNLALNGLHRLHDRYYTSQPRTKRSALGSIRDLLARGANVAYDALLSDDSSRIFWDADALHQATHGVHLLYRRNNDKHRSYRLNAEDYRRLHMSKGLRQLAVRAVFAADLP